MKRAFLLLAAILLHVGSDPGTKHRHRRTSPGTQKRHLARIPKSDRCRSFVLVFFHSSIKGRTASLDAPGIHLQIRLQTAQAIITQEDSLIKSPDSHALHLRTDRRGARSRQKVSGSFGVDFEPFSVLIDAKNRVLWMGNPQSKRPALFIQKIVQ